MIVTRMALVLSVQGRLIVSIVALSLWVKLLFYLRTLLYKLSFWSYRWNSLAENPFQIFVKLLSFSRIFLEILSPTFFSTCPPTT
jgi:hypothetical protein